MYSILIYAGVLIGSPKKVQSKQEAHAKKKVRARCRIFKLNETARAIISNGIDIQLETKIKDSIYAYAASQYPEQTYQRREIHACIFVICIYSLTRVLLFLSFSMYRIPSRKVMFEEKIYARILVQSRADAKRYRGRANA